MKKIVNFLRRKNEDQTLLCAAGPPTVDSDPALNVVPPLATTATGMFVKKESANDSDNDNNTMTTYLDDSESESSPKETSHAITNYLNDPESECSPKDTSFSSTAALVNYGETSTSTAPAPAVGEPRRIVICLSGKRKSGKNFVAARLQERLLATFQTSTTVHVDVVGISSSLQEEFAQLHGLDAERLKSDGEDKQSFLEMVKYGERISADEPGYFCRSALRKVVTSIGHERDEAVHIIVISDCRRPSDLSYFHYAARHNFNPDRLGTSVSDADDLTQTSGGGPPILVRIKADEATRQQRGFRRTAGIDDAPTECALDSDVEWDVIIRNDGDSSLLDHSLQKISNLCAKKLPPNIIIIKDYGVV